MDPLASSRLYVRSCENVRPIHAEVDRAAIAHNLNQIKICLRTRAQSSRVWATIKCDAYGHGIPAIIGSLDGADGLAVTHLGEAHTCRESGWYGPILVYAGLYSQSQTRLLNTPKLHLCINRPEQLHWLETAELDYPPTVWLRFAGDIRHYGLDEQQYGQCYRVVQGLIAKGKVLAVGHMDHFARADDATSVLAAKRRFHAVVKGMVGPISTHNSAALLDDTSHAHTCDDWVRPGLALYGASPIPGRAATSFGLRPSMSLHAELVGVRRLRAGDSLGYGHRFVAPTSMRIGMVSCGYGDGYPRHAPSGTPVAIGDVVTRLVGGMTMDMLTVDLTHTPNAEIGAPVTLWGSAALPADVVAEAVGTIAADLFTSLTARVPIRYVC